MLMHMLMLLSAWMWIPKATKFEQYHRLSLVELMNMLLVNIIICTITVMTAFQPIIQISATATESFMLRKDITDADTLKGALEALSDEIEPNSPPVAASIAYRKNLALSLFYKVRERL